MRRHGRSRQLHVLHRRRNLVGLFGFGSRFRCVTVLDCLRRLTSGGHLLLTLGSGVTHLTRVDDIKHRILLLSTHTLVLSDFRRIGRSLFSAQAFSLSSFRRFSLPLLLSLAIPLTKAVVAHDGHVHRRRAGPEVCDAERGQPCLEFADLVCHLSLLGGSFSFLPQRGFEALCGGPY